MVQMNQSGTARRRLDNNERMRATKIST